MKILRAGDALNEVTGELLWRAYSTGPDSEVLIGTEFKPFYESDRGPDLGVKTWPPEAWRYGGGTVWGWVSYDPDLNLRSITATVSDFPPKTHQGFSACWL